MTQDMVSEQTQVEVASVEVASVPKTRKPREVHHFTYGGTIFSKDGETVWNGTVVGKNSKDAKKRLVAFRKEQKLIGHCVIDSSVKAESELSLGVVVKTTEATETAEAQA